MVTSWLGRSVGFGLMGPRSTLGSGSNSRSETSYIPFHYVTQLHHVIPTHCYPIIDTTENVPHLRLYASCNTGTCGAPLSLR